jgi:hypothetical protein
MRYKSIVLQLLEQYPEFHEQLRSRHLLLPTMEQLARELKTCHEVWKNVLIQRNPDSEPSQIASEAMEIAIKELEDRLSGAFPPEDSETFSLDAAMAFLRNHTLPK